MQVKWADDLVDLLEKTHTGESKIKLLQDFIVAHYEKNGERMTSEDLIRKIEQHFDIPSHNKESHPYWVFYKKVTDLAMTGQFKPIEPVNKFKEILDKIRKSSNK